MRKIGGMFHYEPSKPIENGYFSRICSPKDDLAFAMSGRCGIYYCLQDIARHDTRKVAYVTWTKICTAFLTLQSSMRSVFYLFADTMDSVTMTMILLKHAKIKEL